MFSTVTTLEVFGALSELFGPDFATVVLWAKELVTMKTEIAAVLRK
jgi:hypothetical protein